MKRNIHQTLFYCLLYSVSLMFFFILKSFHSESEHVECRPQGQAMEVPDHNGVGYQRGPQSEAYRSRGQLQRHHTIQTCDDAYVSENQLLIKTDGTKHWSTTSVTILYLVFILLTDCYHLFL